MCASISAALLAWRDDSRVALVVIDHADGTRGFCAGGDVRAVAEAAYARDEAAAKFFLTEYRLNHLLTIYPKPVVAFMDGVTMGGGVGLALPSRWRVATERTVLAMPETAIGFFPDVGSSWRLPRLSGRTGLWLALTGARLGPADCMALGLATHFVRSDSLPELKRLIQERPMEAEALLGAAAADPGPSAIPQHRAALDRAFAAGAAADILAALDAAADPWSAEQAHMLRTRSPQALKVSLELLRRGAAHASFTDAMRMEYRLARRIPYTHDFQQGIRATLIAKDQDPRWFPGSLEAVPDAFVMSLFAPLGGEPEWTPLL